MSDIRQHQFKGIPEHRAGLFEADAVLYQVGTRLLGVPFEFEFHASR